MYFIYIHNIGSVSVMVVQFCTIRKHVKISIAICLSFSGLVILTTRYDLIYGKLLHFYLIPLNLGKNNNWQSCVKMYCQNFMIYRCKIKYN